MSLSRRIGRSVSAGRGTVRIVTFQPSARSLEVRVGLSIVLGEVENVGSEGLHDIPVIGCFRFVNLVEQPLGRCWRSLTTLTPAIRCVS